MPKFKNLIVNVLILKLDQYPIKIIGKIGKYKKYLYFWTIIIIKT